MFRSSLRVFATGIVMVTVPFAARLVLPNAPIQTQQQASPRGNASGTKTGADKPVLGTHSGRHSGQPSTAAQQNPDKSEAADPGATALNLTICHFLDEYTTSHPASEPTGATACLENHTEDVQLLIAIVPDPVHTHLALRFDRAIDDIQDALQVRGWTFDHAWLPWSNKTHAESDRYTERIDDSNKLAVYEKNPGVLLFRGESYDTSPSRQPHLIVLLVGDRPTQGVNPEQFKRAMSIWGQHHTSKPSLDILGPSFSGSTDSLLGLLQHALTPPKNCSNYVAPHITIASGTQSKGSEVSRLTKIASVCGPDIPIDARSFAMDLSYQYTQLFKFLVDHGIKDRIGTSPGKSIVILAEGETSFGQTAVELNDEVRLRPDAFKNTIAKACQGTQLYSCPEIEMQLKAKDELPAKLDPRLIELLGFDLTKVNQYERQKSLQKLLAPLHGVDPPILNYPREISQLRKAYEQNSIVGFASTSSAPRSQLSFSLAQDDHDGDTVTSFSNQQQTLAMETQMAEVARWLNVNHTSVALLSATDVFDEIFVARYLQQHAPAVTVIVQDADVLFLRTGDDESLTNTYVATPWSLIAENGRWSSPSGVYRQPYLAHSQGDQGFYNAVLYLTCRSDESKSSTTLVKCDNGPLREQTPLGIQEYRPPLLASDGEDAALINQRPPLWLSEIGHGRFSPIALIDVDQPNAYLPKAGANSLPPLVAADGQTDSPAGVSASLRMSSKLAVTLIALLLLWHGAACIFSRLDRTFAWSYALADEQHHVLRLTLWCALPLCAVPALQLLNVPIQMTPDTEAHVFRIIVHLLQALAIALALFPLLSKAQYLAEVTCYKRIALFLTIIGTLVISWGIWVWLPPVEHPSERIFFLYRSTDLFNGSSPALTMLLLLAACVVWLHSCFNRLAFYGHRIPQLPGGYEKLYCPSSGSLYTLTHLLSGFRDKWRLLIAAVCAVTVTVGVGMFEDWGPRSLAHGRFDIAVRIFTAMLTVAILYDIAIASVAWHMLCQRCLLRLKYSPIRWGFTWIKGFSWRRLTLSYQRISPHLIYDYLRRMIEADERRSRNPKVLLHKNEVWEYFNGPLSNPQWIQDVTTAMEKLHCALAHEAEHKLSTLSVGWTVDKGPVTGTGKEETRGFYFERTIAESMDDKTRRPILNRQADEEFVALLYLGYIRMVILQIRGRIMTSAVLYVLLLWALTGYPWMNHHAILFGLSVLLGIISVATVFVYAGMHRDDILSRTTETTSGKLDTEFFTRVIPTIGIPLLTLVASQFPELSTFIFSWLEPSLK